MLLHGVDFTTEFQPGDLSYQPRNHRLLGLAAKLAYSDAAAVGALTTYWGFQENEFVFFDRRGSQAFWAASPAMRLLSFRGTASLLDWLRDAKADLIRPGSFGRVHEGFWEAVDFIWPEVKAQLAVTDSRPLFITGHSLGGAMAKAAAVRMAFQLNRRAETVCTFGQPRVGDADFVAAFLQAYQGRSWRYVNNQDIVPHVPTFAMGFRHELDRVFAPSGGSFAPGRDTDEEAMQQNRVEAFAKFGQVAAGLINKLIERSPEQVEDHSMDQYLASFGAQALPATVGGGA